MSGSEVTERNQEVHTAFKMSWSMHLGQIRSLSAIKRAKRELIQEALETTSNRAAHISLSDVQKY